MKTIFFVAMVASFLSFTVAAACSSQAEVESWKCYSPLRSDVSIQAISNASEEQEKIRISPHEFICFDKTLKNEHTNKVSFAAGLPFKYLKNKGEYSFLVNPKDFAVVEPAEIDILNGFEEISFYKEAGGTWSISKDGSKGYVKNAYSKERKLSVGANRKLNLIYFFNLKKEEFNYLVLKVDRRRKCVWSEWPSIAKLEWEAWSICESPTLNN